MKNSNDTIGNRTRDLSACSAEPQPTAPPRAPQHIYIDNFYQAGNTNYASDSYYIFLIVISPLFSYFCYVVSSLVDRFVNSRFPNPWFPRDPTLVMLRSFAFCWGFFSFGGDVCIFVLEKVSVIVYYKQSLYYYYYYYCYYYLYAESPGQTLGQVVC